MADVSAELKVESATKLDSVVSRVIDSFQKRALVGLEKYGHDLDRKDLSFLDWVQHAQEELMDAVLYLEKMKDTAPAGLTLPVSVKNDVKAVKAAKTKKSPKDLVDDSPKYEAEKAEKAESKKAPKATKAAKKSDAVEVK
jgi:hypothetical protein